MNITLFPHGNPKTSVIGPLPASNHTLLQDPRLPTDKQRSLGIVSTGGDGSQGVVVDIHVAQKANSSEFLVALYMVGQTQRWSQAVRVMDLESLNVVAKTPLIQR